jgi:hypothetical protein
LSAANPNMALVEPADRLNSIAFVEPETETDSARGEPQPPQPDVEPATSRKNVWMITKAYHFVRGIWSYGCLVILVSTVAAIPLLQFAAFGYMLECSARMSRRLPWSQCLPGQQTARRIVIAAVCIGLSWLPVWYATDMTYSAELIEPEGNVASRLRILARVLSVVWLGWIGWALFRGGRFRDFLWPAPFRFLNRFWRPSTWRHAEDQLWEFVTSLKLPKLLWLGALASLGAILWLVIPASLIILSLSNRAEGVRAVSGLIGVPLMLWVLPRIPYLQVRFAREKRFRVFLENKAVVEGFRKTPWSMLWGIAVLFVFATPLYVLRIEPIPQELNWILTFFFVFFLFPAHLIVGWAWGRSEGQTERTHFGLRLIAWGIRVSLLLAYIGILYFAKFTSWEGGLVFLLQHTVLPPVPFFVR